LIFFPSKKGGHWIRWTMQFYVIFKRLIWLFCGFEQGSPTPGLQTSLWPLRKLGLTTRGEWWVSKLSFIYPSPLPALPPEPSLPLCWWKNCLPWDWSWVSKRLGTTGLENVERLRLKVGRAVEGACRSLQGNCWVCWWEAVMVRKLSKGLGICLEDLEGHKESDTTELNWRQCCGSTEKRGPKQAPFSEEASRIVLKNT